MYNHGGERVRKSGNVFSGPLTDRLFIYSESSQLLGEYAANGTAVAQYLWLGNMPIGVIQSGQVYAIHTDHLTTPRAVINSEGTTVWRWESLAQPFGESLADNDPDGDGVTFEFNLRFPGQYFDEETGLHYNYFRDYEPNTGRYMQSDPIGLRGGISTYAYAVGNPVNHSDIFGLFAIGPYTQLGGGIGGRAICDGYFLTFELFWTESCTIDCARRHEESHLEDIRIRNPGLCYSLGDSEKMVVVASNAAEKDWTEHKAYSRELSCLKAKFEDCDSDNCANAIKERISFVERIIATRGWNSP